MNMIGLVFDRLTVVADTGRDKGGSILWKCLCLCGGSTITRTDRLKSGQTRSCGCLQRERAIEVHSKHGFCSRKYKHSLYTTWSSMRERCSNPNNPGYLYYGGRGIRVCIEWQDPKTFIAWALNNGWSPGLQCDRIDNDGDYHPGNCRFTTPWKNQQNRRNTKTVIAFGESLPFSYAVKKYSTLSYHTILCRLLNGWDIELALTAPKGFQRYTQKFDTISM